MTDQTPAPGERSLKDRLKELREARGWTQAQLAARAKVERSTIQNVESGRVQRPNTLPHIADALGVTVEELTGDAEPQSVDELEEILEELTAALDRFRRWRGKGQTPPA